MFPFDGVIMYICTRLTFIVCCVLFWFGKSSFLPYSFRINSLALWLSPSRYGASGATLEDIGKYVARIQLELIVKSKQKAQWIRVNFRGYLIWKSWLPDWHQRYTTFMHPWKCLHMENNAVSITGNLWVEHKPATRCHIDYLHIWSLVRSFDVFFVVSQYELLNNIRNGRDMTNYSASVTFVNF